MANANSVSVVWGCEGEQAEIDFSSGIKVHLFPDTIDDPSSAWSSMASDSPGDTTVGVALGQPAALIVPVQGNNGSVSVVDQGQLIVVEGNGTIPLDDLVRVTDSMVPLTKVVPSTSPSATATPSASGE
ncbi:MAG: hypothetical protein ACXWDE_11135 [Aeromicrobium sp.]